MRKEWKPDPHLHPIASDLLAACVINVDQQGDIYASASDGAEVTMGHASNWDWAERYLSDFPNPTDW